MTVFIIIFYINPRPYRGGEAQKGLQTETDRAGPEDGRHQDAGRLVSFTVVLVLM